MNIDKKVKKLLNMLILMPCILHTNIYMFFHFADWKNGLSDEIQLRILAGSITITVSFISYYIILFYLIARFYKENDKHIFLGYIILMNLINILAFFVGYYLR